MIIATPRFWYIKGHWLSTVLWPLSMIYWVLSTTIRAVKKPKKVHTHIVSFGNAVVGGSGKTPTVISIISALLQREIKPYILMRGYGGIHKHPHKVNINCDTHQTVGDEALMMARYAPTWISRNRYLGALECQKNQPNLIILDDGLQNRDLKININIIIINGIQQSGNGCLFPAGPLRERFYPLLKRCDGAILIDGNLEQTHLLKSYSTPVWNATTRPDIEVINRLKYKKIYAFSGLGFNEKFFNMLQLNNLNLVQMKSYPDHYNYRDYDLQTMFMAAQKSDAKLVTTEKDWYRLDYKWRSKVITIPITIDIDNIDTLISLIKHKRSHVK